MKYISIASFIFIISFSSLAQGFKIVGVSNNSVRVDSVTFGFDNNATIGIDTQLGEVNIFNQPAKPFDMRVVQRDSTNFSCTYTFIANNENDRIVKMNTVIIYFIIIRF